MNEFASVFDKVVWTWSAAGRPFNIAQARNAAISANQGKEVQITFETVFTTAGHPFDVMEPRGIRSVERRSHEGIELLCLEDDEGPWVLVATPTRHEGVFHLISGLPVTHPRSRKVERWLVRTRDVSRCYLNHDDFASIGDRLSEWGNVEVVKVAARVVSDGSSINRGFPVQTNALRPSHRDALVEVEERAAAVRTLTLYVDSVMHVHLRRVAGATLYSGRFDVFREQVLDRLEQSSAERRALLTGRERHSLSSALMPLTVALPQEVLHTREDTATVLNAVRSMPNISMAIFHRNPYLHFVVTDEVDGSNFDVMITRPDAIDVYPGYRATVAAFGRITQQFSERFGALEIRERNAVEPTSIFDLIDN